MQLKMYSIYDQKVEAYLNPMFFRSNGEALRAFMDEVGRQDSAMNAHPEDYVLYFIGVWDDDNGLVVGTDTPMVLARASDL